MKKNNPVVTLIIFCIVSIVLVIAVLNMGGNSSLFETDQAKISMIFHVLGGWVALYSAVLLFLRTAEGAEIQQVAPLALPLLGGVVVTGGHWAGVVTLGAVVVAILLRETFGGKVDRRSAGPARSSGGGNAPSRPPRRREGDQQR